MKKLMTAAALATLLTGCVTFPTQESEQVKVIWDDVNAIANCQHLGTVMAQKATFMDYWLHADKDMVWGTLNQMRIKAAELGADTLYLYQPLGFSSSVTMFANAYQCQN
ncbi:LOW QUALITY PROTEIN: putative outer membrane lipoprotein [Vibrio sp. JCM 19052]|nr:LOW QUALITY PROTEIN: putative outer membrane lipoprotein [Vibrio sp. JCM 19052]